MKTDSPFTLTAEEADMWALRASQGSRLTFSNLANRNWVAKIAKNKYRARLVKSSHRNQLYDPRYTVEGAGIPDRGLANDYKHYHKALYILEPDRW